MNKVSSVESEDKGCQNSSLRDPVLKTTMADSQSAVLILWSLTHLLFFLAVSNVFLKSAVVFGIICVQRSVMDQYLLEAFDTRLYPQSEFHIEV